MAGCSSDIASSYFFRPSKVTEHVTSRVGVGGHFYGLFTTYLLYEEVMSVKTYEVIEDIWPLTYRLSENVSLVDIVYTKQCGGIANWS